MSRIDAHVHVVDFLQHVGEPGDLLAALDQAGAARAVVFGLPVKKKWAASEPMRPTYYLDDNAPCATYELTDELVADFVAALPAQQRSRLAPLVCGFDPTDLLAVEHVERMIERHDCWRGVGELLLRHDDLTNLTYGETARAGHPALDPVLDLCRERDWPVSVHQDSSSAGRWDAFEYVGELRQMLDRHPGTTVVWCHAGASRRVVPGEHVSMVRDMLMSYPRLHVDLSWAVYDELVTREGEVQPAWVDLVRDHPDRFVLGSDVFGSFKDLPDKLDRFDRMLDRLPAPAAAQVGHGNAERLWFR
jgi:predicted TIM-barrel fold metal-dependent hydrolase